MCPVCVSTTAALIAATTSGAGVLGFVAVRFRWLQRLADRTVPESLRRKSWMDAIEGARGQVFYNYKVVAIPVEDLSGSACSTRTRTAMCSARTERSDAARNTS
jgi:hypothetical protein